MSYLDQILVPCPDLQRDVFEAWGRSTIPRDRLTFLEYINSPENRNGIDMQVAPGQGKVRTVNVTYRQRLLESAVTAATERDCAVQEVEGNKSKDYTIDTDDLLKTGERVTAKHLARACKDNGQYMAEVLAWRLSVLDQAIATEIGKQAALLRGAFSKDAKALYSIPASEKMTVRTKDASGNYQLGAHTEIQLATEMSGYNSAIMFGGGVLKEYMNLSIAGCCANSGLDVLELYNTYGYAFGYDRRLAEALGGQSSNLIMEPQSLQLLHYTENEWDDNAPIEKNGNYVSFTLRTPAGVPVDINITDTCANKIDMNFFANIKLVGLPEDMYRTGDNFEGVTYVGQVDVDNS
jgi:hypothetical protein